MTKATGIIRKIDELGRIVIPKEIRKTLRIRETDSIEIFVENDNNIVLRKYSPMGELKSFAKDYTESLARISGRSVCITDKEHIIAASGGAKKLLLDKPLSRDLELAMIERKNILASKNDKNYIQIVDDELNDYQQQIISPIISEGDILGNIIMLAKNGTTKLSVTEEKLVATASDFLGRFMAS